MAPDSDTSGDEDAPVDETVASVAPVRSHYIIRSHRRRDRLVKTLDEALDVRNYDMLPPVGDGDEIRYELSMAGDKQWGTTTRTLTYTNKPPPPGRLAPENIMSKGRTLSSQAQAAKTPQELWQLFFTDEMLDLIVERTNEKIAESCQDKSYSAERLQQSPYIKPVDKVKSKFSIAFGKWWDIRYGLAA